MKMSAQMQPIANSRMTAVTNMEPESMPKAVRMAIRKVALSLLKFTRCLASLIVLPQHAKHIGNSALPAIISVKSGQFSGCPATIGRLVVPVIVNAIHPKTFRSQPHIFKEVFKLFPSLTNRDALLNVMRMKIAAIVHCIPRSICRAMAALSTGVTVLSIAPVTMKFKVMVSAKPKRLSFDVPSLSDIHLGNGSLISATAMTKTLWNRHILMIPALFTLALVLLFSPSANAQSHGYRYQQTSINAKGQPLVGATITVCASPATGAPCTPLINIFADEALTTPKANPFVSDSLGNWDFYVSPGVYSYTISGNGIRAQGPIQITVPCVINGASCGGGTGGGSGVDVNVIAKGTGPTNPLVDSSGFDDGTLPTQWPLGLNVVSQGIWYRWNNAPSPGTVANETAVATSTGTVNRGFTSTTTGVIGIAGNGAGTTGQVDICWAGRCQVLFDNTANPEDWAIPSTTTAGYLHDTGSQLETPGIQNFLIVGANAGAGTLGVVALLSPDSIGTAANCTGVMTLLGDTIYGGTGGVCTRLAGPTTPNSVPRVLTSTPSAGAATAPAWSLFGIGWRSVTGATDTVLATDRSQGVHYSRVTSIAVTVPSAASLGSNFAFYTENNNIGPVTFTPTTSTVNGHASIILYYGDSATWSSDNTNYTARITRAGHTCSIPIGTDNGAVLVDADLGPQGGICQIPPYNAKVIEIQVKADAGTPSVIVRKESGVTNTNLLSSALATGAAGVVACSNAGGTLSVNGVTTCTNTLQNVDVVPGDWFGLTSGTAGGTAKRMSISIIFGETP